MICSLSLQAQFNFTYNLHFLLHNYPIACLSLNPIWNSEGTRSHSGCPSPMRGQVRGRCQSVERQEEACQHANSCSCCRTGLNRTLSWSGLPAWCTLGEVEPKLLCQPGLLSVSMLRGAALDIWLPCGCEHPSDSFRNVETRMYLSRVSDSDRYRSGEWSQLAVPSLQISSLWPFLCRWAGAGLYMLMCPFILLLVLRLYERGLMRDSNRGVGEGACYSHEDHVKSAWKWHWLF